MARLPHAALRDARAAVLSYLSENDLTLADFADMLGTTSARVALAIRGVASGWFYFRLRIQIERLIGETLWSPPQAAGELRQIGERLGVDMLTAEIKTIRHAAFKAKIALPETSRSAAPGYAIFRALIAHYFPDTSTLKSAPYETA